MCMQIMQQVSKYIMSVYAFFTIITVLVCNVHYQFNPHKNFSLNNIALFIKDNVTHNSDTKLNNGQGNHNCNNFADCTKTRKH